MRTGSEQRSFPLPLYRVLEEEDAAISGTPARGWWWRLRPENLRDPAAFAHQILASSAPHFAWLRSELAALPRSSFASLAQAQAPAQSRRLSAPPPVSALELTHWLNQLLALEDLWERAKPLLTPEQRGWLSESNPAEASTQERRCLNRWILEALFPNHLDPRPSVAEFYARVHQRPQRRTALCLSGGGIRSATFALGVLQGLARRGVLERFDYLSTVSGGGYIGSWLSSWISRDPERLRGVTAELGRARPGVALEAEPGPVQHLRQFSNFLSPRFSWFSTDMWTLIGTYLRNLTLNWFVLVPLLLGILFLPRVCVAWLSVPPSLDWRRIVLIFGFLTGAVGLAYLISNRPSLSEVSPRHSGLWSLAQSLTGFMRFCFVPLMASAMSLSTWWAWNRAPHADQGDTPAMIASWSALLSFAGRGAVLAILLWLAWRLASWWKKKTISSGAAVIAREVGSACAFGVVSGLLTWGVMSLRDKRALAFGLFGAGVHGLAWLGMRLFFWITEQRFWWAQPKTLYRAVEVALVAVTGAAGGLLMWSAANLLFEQPVQRELQARPAAVESAAAPGQIQATLQLSLPGSTATNAATNLAYRGELSLTNPAATRVLSKLAPSPSVAQSVKVESFDQTILYACVAVPMFLILFLITATFYIGIASNWIVDKDLEWWGRTGSVFLKTALAWAVVGLCILYGPYLIFEGGWGAMFTTLGGGAGLFSWLAGFSAKTPADSENSGEGGKKSWLMERAVQWAAPIAVLVLAVTLSWLCSVGLEQFYAKAWFQNLNRFAQPSPSFTESFYSGHLSIVRNSPLWLMLAVTAGLILAGWLLSFAVNSNKFSLHGVYRNRLVRAYLGASQQTRHPHWMTGFDDADNLPLHYLQPGFLHAEHIREPARLIHEISAPNPRAQILATFLRQEIREKNPGLAKALEENSNAAQAGAALPETILEEVIRHLNELIAGPPLDTESFVISPPAAPQALVLNSPARLPADATESQITLHNRRLLSWAYPGTFAELSLPAHVSGTAHVPLRPLHVVNVALNLVAGDNLAWQERQADSFSMSPLHCGNRRLGYRRSSEYSRGRRNAVTLGTALTISGAAASPNMGYHSSPAVTFLLTLLNVRLGWWLGNPGLAGQGTYFRNCPRRSFDPLWREAFGKTRDTDPYVYLSDGGHFDNLGLYEMVLRRCHYIVVSDASADPKASFADLASSIRKIRIDLGIPITYENFPIEASPNGPTGKCCALGTIDYQAVDGPAAVNGTLIYLKPSICENEPRDVLSYKQRSKDFPHESTSDQFFSESQLESYRALGSHLVELIWGEAFKPQPADEPGLKPFAERARLYLARQKNVA